MTEVVIYTNEGCSYCTMAKELLAKHGLPYTEKKLGSDFTREYILEHYPGQTSYPVIVIDGMNVGGYNGLKSYLVLSEAEDTDLKFLTE